MLEMKLVLASTSPRRNELLRLLGIPFEKRPSNADETHPEDVDTLEYVLQMAREKGQIVRHSEGEWILSADTIVALDGRVVGNRIGPGADGARLTGGLSNEQGVLLGYSSEPR